MRQVALVALARSTLCYLPSEFLGVRAHCPAPLTARDRWARAAAAALTVAVVTHGQPAAVSNRPPPPSEMPCSVPPD